MPSAFGGDQHALRIEAVEQVVEALTLLADPILDGNPQIVDEQLVGGHRVPAHLRIGRTSRGSRSRSVRNSVMPSVFFSTSS